MAAPILALPLTANRSLNNAAAAQAFDALTANLFDQITAGTVKDYHDMSKWHTPQGRPEFELDPTTPWLKTISQLAICMEPELS